ncbi:hypothetical protein N657DRAFT_672237 [Parathielavia appendiculata]|uniref:Nucleolar 27S pre-rRNA processing Urb2/Npa2 C-terminal domain-containing protein n=1 Tax=Parathielavia appendiculata TaxID=2587402 RepID=A0AAN6TYT2_9PEZI|nr:hypothetical protein N657DRAFT_672237 [Parathielavia appendiculata]
MVEMGEHNRTGDAALVRAVRLLDQGDAEAIPDRLERVWNALQDYRRGSPHSAEMLLRWLLKNMAGSTANTERVRRYPRVWDILGAVFALVPTISLAKSLADRRFVGILQQTLKEIAAPQEEEVAQNTGTDSDVDMADASPLESPGNPRKRKRTDPASFDLKIQSQVAGCLQTAESVFDALRILLSRCEQESLDGPVAHRMGAEHVKSLFAVSAAEIMGILVPWLTICGFALDKNKAGVVREQSSWVSTWAAFWALHRQSAADASEVATHLSGTAFRLLGKLTGTSRQTQPGMDVAVQDRWAKELRLFLSRNLILPARALFLTNGSKEVVQIAVDMSSAYAHITFPVLFDLVSKSPLEFGGKTSRKQYEAWIQTVFDAIVHASKNINRENRKLALRAIMEMAAGRSTSLSASSLRAVCKDYAIGKNNYDWSLLLSIITLNPDVFLVTEEGNRLLEQALEKTRESDPLDAADSEEAGRFIVRLADGYAQARDLSTFIKVWLKHLAPIKAKAGLPPLWAQQELDETVAKLIQTSLNSNQLVDILDWLSSQTQPSEGTARIHILEAISSGISQEEFVDAANMKTFEGTLLEKYSKKDLPAVSACRWMVAAKAISRGTLEEAGQIWSQVRSDIKSVLRKSPVDSEGTFAAFKCCVATWLANHPGGAYEDDAATLICSFAERLEEDGDSMEINLSDGGIPVSKGTYVSWILSEAPRVLSLLVEKNDHIPKAVSSLLAIPRTEDAGRLEPVLAACRLLLDRESSSNDQKLMDTLIETMISMIHTSKSGRLWPQTKTAIQVLLGVPTEVLSRTQREAAMKSLVSHLPGESDKPDAIAPDYWMSVLSLMVKLMRRPTFYEGMSFSHLESIGRCLLKAHNRSNRRTREGVPADDGSGSSGAFKSLQQLAMLSIRQMASGNPEEREKSYLEEAASLLQSPCQDSDVSRIVLLQAYISTLQASPALETLEADGLDLNSLKNHLLQLTLPIIASKKRNGKSFPALLIALEALSDLDREAVRQVLANSAPGLLKTSDSLLENGVKAGWGIRIFLANFFPEALTSPLRVRMSPETSTAAEQEDEPRSSEPAATLGKTALLRYVDAVVRSADEETKRRYLQELLLEDSDGPDVLGRLLVIYRLVQHLKGSSRPLASSDQFDLSQAHSILCGRLMRIKAPAPFLLTSKAIHLLLDQNPASMTQWNIELTLCTVSTISLQPSTQALIAESPNIYPSLCRLVEMIIKRHRKRLDGHFHALITPLQSLIRLLLSRPCTHPPTIGSSTTTAVTSISASTTSPEQTAQWEKHAKLFARLLTLVCEPTVASVSRHSHSHSHASGPLDSEKDRAKRYAGQYMHRVLAEYVRLQLEYVVPHGVREALEPGMYSVLDITGQDVLRSVNDAMDASGSVIFKEMYKMYQRFGKWTGV